MILSLFVSTVICVVNALKMSFCVAYLCRKYPENCLLMSKFKLILTNLFYLFLNTNFLLKISITVSLIVSIGEHATNIWASNNSSVTDECLFSDKLTASKKIFDINVEQFLKPYLCRVICVDIHVGHK